MQSFVQSVSNLLMEENRERWEEAQLVKKQKREKKCFALSPTPVIASFHRHNNSLKSVGIDDLDCATKTQVDTQPTCVFSHWQRCKEGQEETSARTEIALAMSNSANVSTHSSICRTPPLMPPCLCFCPTARPLHRCVTILATELRQANRWCRVWSGWWKLLFYYFIFRLLVFDVVVVVGHCNLNQFFYALTHTLHRTLLIT